MSLSPLSPQLIPVIPDSAPFSPEQRAWLNGFLAGLFSSAPAAAPAPQPVSLRVAVLFASQTGTAERLAKKLVKELKARGHAPELASLETFPAADLAKYEQAALFASTYGEGDPPDSAKRFTAELFADTAPVLKTLSFSLFALGDHHYEHFCKFGIDVDTRLQALGATRLAPRVDSDVDTDAPFAAWKTALLAELDRIAAPSVPEAGTNRTSPPVAEVASPAQRPAEPDQLHTRDNPFLAALVDRRALTSGTSSKLTLHLAFDLADSALHYLAGDALGVLPTNDPALVAELLSHLPFPGDAPITIPSPSIFHAPSGAISVEQALLHHLQPTRLTRKIVEAFARKAESKPLLALLAPEQAAHLDTFMYDRGLIDLLLDHPGVLTSPQDLADILPRLAPRLYSISSSPAAHGRELHTTVAVVRYRSHNRERGGVCSTLFADRTPVGERIPVYIQPNKKFRLPVDPATPVIMVGPGTGIAPFRAFLHERKALASPGKNWLFFGERSASTDFLYCDELEQMTASGHTRLATAFSRDQPQKIYVQDRMLENGAELWQWLSDGAQFFICGDASRMAKDVDAALHTIAEQHGNLAPDAAKDFVADLHDQHRYHRDVY